MPPLRRTFGVPDLDDRERAEAAADPGPSWREWLYFEFLKVWIVLGFLIVDSWIAASWLGPLNAPGLTGSLALALYLEFLAYRYLWYRPDIERFERDFRPTWLRPVRVGRWTPEAWRLRAGQDPYPGVQSGPDPRDFL